MSWYQSIPPHEKNDTLLANVAPSDWQNPTASGVYDFVVLGGGSAGLVAASGAAQLGARVALIERHLLGGDCLNVGCIPSKALIRAAKVMGEINRAGKFGITVPDGVTTNFSDVMAHVWGVRAEIAPHDSAERYRKLGVDVYFGSGVFTSPSALTIGDQTLHFKKALIATGSSPLVIPIPGLKETGFLTNETLWNLTQQPKTMAIIGAGPIGSEMAQSFQRLGTQITLIDLAPQILIREDKDAAKIVQSALIGDGVDLKLAANTKQISPTDDGRKKLELEIDGKMQTIIVDEILLAIGRRANMDGLGLEAAGVKTHKRGITVGDNLQTTNPNIYAAGDVAMKYQFTHAAGFAAAIVIQNALIPGPDKKLSDLIMPWVTYTDPEIAHVGLYPSEAQEAGIALDNYTQMMETVDRAVAEGDTEGFVKVHVKKGGDKILGATIVSHHAGEMISEITMAMKFDIGLGKISGVIHPYPTQAEAIHKLAGTYNKTRLTPFAKKAVGILMRLKR